MVAKMGRPLKGTEKRDKRLEVRLTESEIELLNTTAAKLEMTRVDTIVRAVEELADRLEG